MTTGDSCASNEMTAVLLRQPNESVALNTKLAGPSDAGVKVNGPLGKIITEPLNAESTRKAVWWCSH